MCKVFCDRVAIRARVKVLRDNRRAGLADSHRVGDALAPRGRIPERGLFALVGRTIPAASLIAVAGGVEQAERS